MLYISRSAKVRLVEILIIVFLLAFIASITTSGCAFTHRGETSVGLFKDVERSGEGTSKVLISRPARD
jgi:hypothetical protein